MALPPYPLINGVYYDFNQIELSVGSPIFNGFKAINYTQDLEHAEVWGNGPEKLANTLGQLKCSGNLEWFMPQYRAFLASAGTGWLTMQFPITVQFAAQGLPLATDNLVGVRFKNAGRTFSAGADALAVKLDFTAFKLIEDGIAPIAGIP